MLATAAIASLIAAVAGGLARAGVPLPLESAPWLGAGVGAHAFLMVCTFMGTLIGLERALALKTPSSWLGPLACALAALAALCGASAVAAWLVVAASLAFSAIHLAIVRREAAPHTVLLLVAALAWMTGSFLHALGAAPSSVVPWWFAFLVLTIAAERLEMTRLLPRRHGAAGSLYAVAAVMLAACAVSARSQGLGGALYGTSLMALSIWLLRFDVARRTVRAGGLARYMACALLLGYGWLLVAGAAWAATSLGLSFRDAALHGLALGFVLSTMLGHAPVILPAIARVKVRFGAAYYVPLFGLHASLLLRLLPGHADAAAMRAGAIGNALAVALFAATVAGSALAARSRRTAADDEAVARHHR